VPAEAPQDDRSAESKLRRFGPQPEPMRNIQQLGVGQAEGQGVHRERQRRAFGERAFAKFHNDGSSSGNMFEEKREAVIAIEAAVLPLIPKALAA
jgi:hypothetical protein